MNELLRDHQRQLYRHARAIVHDGDLACDVLQTAMLLIARRIGSLRDARWFRAWAYRIVTREALRSARRRGRDNRLFNDSFPIIEFDADLATEAEAAELLRLCANEIDRLPEASRSVLRLHYLDGLTQTEIAEALELPLGTVKSRLAYGIERLRRKTTFKQ